MIRYLLEDHALPYEEELVSPEAWTDLKSTMVFGQIPLFRDGDFELVQSGAIIRYLARKHDLYGSNHKEAALIDMIYEGRTDFRQTFINMVKVKENYEEAKAAFFKNLHQDLGKFENLLKQNNGGQGFFVGNKISFADYAMFDILYNLELYGPGCLQCCPLLQGFFHRMQSRDNITKYMAQDAFKALKLNRDGRL